MGCDGRLADTKAMHAKAQRCARMLAFLYCRSSYVLLARGFSHSTGLYFHRLSMGMTVLSAPRSQYGPFPAPRNLPHPFPYSSQPPTDPLPRKATSLTSNKIDEFSLFWDEMGQCEGVHRLRPLPQRIRKCVLCVWLMSPRICL